MFRVVLVEPYYAGNIGSVARLCMNFDIHELVLVNPHESPLSEEALKWAVNAKSVLERAKIYSSLKKAIEDSAIVVGTTAKPHEKRSRRVPITPREFATLVKDYWNSDEVVSILFGREPSGLTNEELDLTDITVTIPTSPRYPALNLSHAVAIILYELYLQKAREFELTPPTEKNLRLLEKNFEILARWSQRRNLPEVLHAFRSVLRRGARTDKEVRAILGVIGFVARKLQTRD